MMSIIQRIASQLNVPAQCRKYGLSIWQCPQFLFCVMGAIIIFATVLSYQISLRFVGDPEIVALLVLFLAALLFIIATVITRSFERLAEANRMKSEFITIVSHQLRSPLTSLRWALDFIISGDLGKIEEKPLEYLKILKENSDRMEELVRDLLIVSRIEQKEAIMLKKEIALEEIVKELIKEYAPFAAASNISIKFNCQESLPGVFADPSQIKIAVEALIDNAIRYTKGKGEIQIEIKAIREKVYFKIKDSGIGIPRDDQKFIFQKFFRTANALKHQTQGSGLGLFITKNLIVKSGGEMWFESGEGKGSTFYFTLPVK